MRVRLFIPMLVLVIICAALWVVALWQFGWTSAGGQLRLVLGQGSVHLWIGSRGDLVNTGFSGGHWTGDALMWMPRVNPETTRWVESGGPVRKQITGFTAVIPLWLPALGLAALAGVCGPPWVARRRGVRDGRMCHACGYEVTATDSTCPECGRDQPARAGVDRSPRP